MNLICAHCQALKFENEPPGMCCLNGKIQLPILEEPPDPLRYYLSGTSAESQHFLKNIRKYNCCFQMTSFGATRIVNYGNFMPTFKVQGQIYHQIGSLLPLPENESQFLQIYFMGNEAMEIDQRCEIVQGIRREIISALQTLFHTHNELINQFKTAEEQLISNDYKIVIKADRTPDGEHERRFNAPTTEEMAIVLIGSEYTSRDIIVSKRSNELQRISETHRMYDALQYPIIFWKGQSSYDFSYKHLNPKTNELTIKKVGVIGNKKK